MKHYEMNLRLFDGEGGAAGTARQARPRLEQKQAQLAAKAGTSTQNLTPW